MWPKEVILLKYSSQTLKFIVFARFFIMTLIPNLESGLQMVRAFKNPYGILVSSFRCFRFMDVPGFLDFPVSKFYSL